MVRSLVSLIAVVALATFIFLWSSDPPEDVRVPGVADLPVTAPKRPTAPTTSAIAHGSEPASPERLAASTPATEPGLPPGTGIVVHDGGVPLPRARVRLVVRRPLGRVDVRAEPLVRHVESGSDGRFVIPEEFLVPDRMFATAERDGFGPGSAELDASKTLRLVLGRPSTIRGRVVELETGAPIADAELIVESMLAPTVIQLGIPSELRRTRTRADGSFAFGRCFVGESLSLTVRPRHCLPHTERFTPPTVGEHQVDIEVPIGESLAVRVVDAIDRRGVADAEVHVSGNPIGRTLADGTIRVGRRPNPTFPLEILAEGFLRTHVQIDATRLAMPEVVVPLVHETILEGRVTDAGGRPLADVRVSLHDDYGEGPGAVSDDDGWYAVREIETPRRLEVRVRGAGATPYRLAPVAFERSGTRHRLDIELPAAAATLFGNVTRDGAPTQARVSWSAGLLSAERMTRADGGFSFAGVPPERVTVTVRLTALAASRSSSVTLRAGEERRLDLDVVADTSALAGTVFDCDGGPAAGVEVVVTGRSSGAVLRGVTDAAGRFSLIVPSSAETFDLEVTVAGRSLFRFGVTAGSTALVLQPSR